MVKKLSAQWSDKCYVRVDRGGKSIKGFVGNNPPSSLSFKVIPIGSSVFLWNWTKRTLVTFSTCNTAILRQILFYPSRASMVIPFLDNSFAWVSTLGLLFSVKIWKKMCVDLVSLFNAEQYVPQCKKAGWEFQKESIFLDWWRGIGWAKWLVGHGWRHGWSKIQVRVQSSLQERTTQRKLTPI